MRRVALASVDGDLGGAVRSALEGAGILGRVTSEKRIALKPNFTYPYYKPGVTTSPAVIREALRVLRDFTPRIVIVETDGGYGAWRAEETFAGHGIYDLGRAFGARVVNLCDEPREMIEVRSGGRIHRLPLPVRLLRDTDLLISLPVPKVHAMTRLTLAYKNQWGCIPDGMRLRRHHIFDDAIVAVNRALRPAVLSDGTYFLDRRGPMDGDPVRMDLIIAASDAGAFDRYVSELMGVPWRRVRHLRRAAALGDMPEGLDEIAYNVPPGEARRRTFRLERSARHWIALAGFRSRLITWLGYEAWFGRVVLHGLLYAVAGKPVKPKLPEGPALEPGRGPAEGNP